MVEVKQFEVDQIIFGQDADVQVELKDSEISPIHCLIELRDSGYYVCDLGSSSGTFKNGQQILDEPISSGDQIRLGPYTIHFFVGVPKPKVPPVTETVTPPPALPPAAPVVRAASVPPAAPVAPVVTATPKPPKNDQVAPAAPKLPESPKADRSTAHVGSKKSRKHKKTFAPNSAVTDLREVLRPGKGPHVEVLVAWKERILNTTHVPPHQLAVIGTSNSAQVIVPNGFIRGDLPFIDTNAGCSVAIPAEATADVLGSQGEVKKPGVSGSYRLEQGELLALSFSGGILQVYVRYSPATNKPLFAPMLDFTSGELTGIVATLVMVALSALYMSVYSPPPSEDKKEDEQVRLATFLYNKPKAEPTPMPKAEPTPPPVKDPVVTATPTPEPKKIQVTDKKQEQTQKGVKDSTAAAAERPAARAMEVRAKPSKVDRPKKFTSTKQGGAVKMGETEGSNAQSAKDVTKTGLLSAFGGGGNRSKLDQAYSGSGDLLGMANEATGKAGQNENRAGDDLGSKFKDTGAGGKGTATTGISGVGTKGRSSGQSAYGGIGFGGKGSVRVEAGGTEEDFVGKIDREAVRRAVRALLPLIQNCYNRALNLQKDLEGKIIIRFVIGEQGKIQSANTKSSTMSNSDVEGCVARTIKNGGGFPEPPGGTIAEVDFPFIFSPPN